MLINIVGTSSDVKDTDDQSGTSQKKLCEETTLAELFTNEIATAKHNLASNSQSSSKEDEDNELTSKVHFSGHRAGFDAFMTAYSFAVYLCKKKMKCSNTGQEAANHKTACILAELEPVKNKIVISGKSLPLLVAKSHFAKTSQRHQLRMAELLKHHSIPIPNN